MQFQGTWVPDHRDGTTKAQTGETRFTPSGRRLAWKRQGSWVKIKVSGTDEKVSKILLCIFTSLRSLPRTLPHQSTPLLPHSPFTLCTIFHCDSFLFSSRSQVTAVRSPSAVSEISYPLQLHLTFLSTYLHQLSTSSALRPSLQKIDHPHILPSSFFHIRCGAYLNRRRSLSSR